jgi:hypothetical protein
MDFPGYYPWCIFIVLGDRDDGNFITECLLDAVYLKPFTDTEWRFSPLGNFDGMIVLVERVE